jgi:hypothetical protein
MCKSVSDTSDGNILEQGCWLVGGMSISVRNSDKVSIIYQIEGQLHDYT